MESVDPKALPSLPLNCRKAFPSVSAVYFALSKNNEILYIGRSINLRNRWSDHHQRSRLEEIGEVRIAWLEINNRTLLPKTEYALIERFQPPFNSVNNALREDQRNAREKTFTIRFSDKEWERLHKEAERQEVPASQLIRDWLKSLDKEVESVA